MLIDDFVEIFNEHRKANYSPSDKLTADRSMSPWYGLSGFWGNMDPSPCTALEGRPENACEIQDLCDGRTGILLRLSIVKTARKEARGARADEETNQESGNDDQDERLHDGGRALLELVMPWANTGRIVCADSFFASVATATELLKNGLRFTGVVETATKEFPLAYFHRQRMGKRGDWLHLVARDEHSNPFIFAVVFLDRDRQHFVSTVRSMRNREACQGTQWRRVGTTPHMGPKPEDHSIPQPMLVEEYYETCGQIDWRNRVCQDDLEIERTVRTMDVWRRLGQTLFGMCVVDSYYLFRECTGSEESKHDFFSGLAEEMIDNTFNRGTCPPSRLGNRVSASPNTGGSPESMAAFASGGVSHHLTPAKATRRRKNGEDTPYIEQRGCRICKKKVTTVCSTCVTEGVEEKKAYFCHPRKGHLCYAQHLREAHMLQGSI